MEGREAKGGEQQDAQRMQGEAGHPTPLHPGLATLPAPASYLLYKYFLNYQRILVSTFCAWLVSRSEGDRDRVESTTEKEKPRKEEADGEIDSDRECQRQSRTDRWGEKAELKSVAPEQSGAEAKSRENRQVWNPGPSTRRRTGAGAGTVAREKPGLPGGWGVRICVDSRKGRRGWGEDPGA